MRTAALLIAVFVGTFVSLSIAAGVTARPAHADTFPCQYDANDRTLVVLGGTGSHPGDPVTVHIRHHHTRHYVLDAHRRVIRDLPFTITTRTVRASVSGQHCETT